MTRFIHPITFFICRKLCDIIDAGTTEYTYIIDNLIHSVYNANSIYYQYSYDLFGRISNCVITNNNSNVIDTTALFIWGEKCISYY